MLKWLPGGKNLAPARILALGFAAMIALGTFLLSLPIAVKEGSINLIDALFTATSAVCVTGLVVVDTGTYFTRFGHTVIMVLILAGALGFMTAATVIFILLGKRITLSDRLVIKEALNSDSIQGLVLTILTIVKIAALSILVGSTLLAYRFVPQFGWSEGIYFSLFHAVSAFANAGFDLFGEYQSLNPFRNDFLVAGTILVLFVFGGLGFTVILDIFQQRRFSCFSLHSKLVLAVTFLLLSMGTIIILFLEHNNPATLGSVTAGNRLLAAVFMAATPRTAGFSLVPTQALLTPTLFFLLFLMFIGASPASTGGGIKTTTFGLVLATVRSLIRGNEDVVLYAKRIPGFLIYKAVVIIFVSISLIFSVIFAMTVIETMPLQDIVFEVFSAFGTVGLSTGITPLLSDGGKLLLALTMYTGRIGPLTMLYALARRLRLSTIRYPEERVLIG